ncbi:Protein of uncharacterised function (DUF434) [uncultured Clostridium sp.]|uniref:DUF434 domain-containing protein n=1 Tax=uncultured Clostridium sp. TaxID=59620 RepID=UPI000822D504|nr:DUF434 domain-containing protein [uncultured Clostridium sp.]SCJ90008.1 Protein of uncharacterised function (DUF434) [uncultured Clostridium sp.]
MTKISKRGFDLNDIRWFSEKEIIRLRKAHDEIKWLLDRNYKLESIINFVGSRYQFSTRQRDSLKRATSGSENEIIRKSKELSINEIAHKTLNIDGFNLIINLEVALSGGTLIIGDDGLIRDLAGLRGTYRLIDKTDIALDYMFKFLTSIHVETINFYLDSPVSNSGSLKLRILEYAEKYNLKTNVELVNNADVILEKLSNVITSDATILDKCSSYFNLSKNIIDEYIKDARIISLT